MSVTNYKLYFPTTYILWSNLKGA